MPFYLRTGKRLPTRMTEIAVLFQRAPHLPFDATDTEELGQNALVIRVQPDEGVTLRFGSKVPGSAMEVRDVNMDFAYGESFTESSPEAYERLLLDVLIGDPPLFPRQEEVELSWQILDPIEEFWASARQARAVPGRHRRPGRRGRAARPRRPRLAPALAARSSAGRSNVSPKEPTVLIDLTDTTTAEIRGGADARPGPDGRPRDRRGAQPDHHDRRVRASTTPCGRPARPAASTRAGCWP